MIPATPTTTTHSSSKPNVAPAWVLKTRSPMSTNPPIADMIPSAIWRNCFTGASPAARLSPPLARGVERAGAAPRGRSPSARAGRGRRSCVERGPRAQRASGVSPLASTASDARAAFVSSAAWTRTNVDVERPRAASEARSPPSAASDWRPAACCCRACLPGAPCPPQPASSSTPVSAAAPTRSERLRPARRRARR